MLNKGIVGVVVFDIPKFLVVSSMSFCYLSPSIISVHYLLMIVFPKLTWVTLKINQGCVLACKQLYMFPSYLYSCVAANAGVAKILGLYWMGPLYALNVQLQHREFPCTLRQPASSSQIQGHSKIRLRLPELLCQICERFALKVGFR